MKILPAFQDLSEMYYVSSKTCSRFVTFVVRPVIDLLKLHHISGTSKFIIVNIFYNSKSYRSFTCAKIFLILDSMVENCIRVCLFVCQHSCLVENVKVCSLIVFILTFFLFSTACPLFLPWARSIAWCYQQVLFLFYLRVYQCPHRFCRKSLHKQVISLNQGSGGKG